MDLTYYRKPTSNGEIPKWGGSQSKGDTGDRIFFTGPNEIVKKNTDKGDADFLPQLSPVKL